MTARAGDIRAGRAPGLQPVVLGLAGRQLGLGRHETVLLLLHLYVAGCLGAALRLLRGAPAGGAAAARGVHGGAA